MEEQHNDSAVSVMKLIQTCERPVIIGFTVGLLVGIANSVILSIPVWISLVSGTILGVLITLVACPGMRTALKERRESYSLRMKRIANSNRSGNAFTAID